MKDEYIRRKDAVNIAESYEVKIDGFCLDDYEYGRDQVAHSIADDLEDIAAVDVVPVVRCKECKHFELNPVTVVGGIPLILAHEICHFWGKGCKTSQDGFCSYGERREG